MELPGCVHTLANVAGFLRVGMEHPAGSPITSSAE
jgi:hypothetical protein